MDNNVEQQIASIAISEHDTYLALAEIEIVLPSVRQFLSQPKPNCTYH